MLLFNDLTPQLAIVIILVALVSMTIHEFAHCYVAHLMGDWLPKQQGRLTLNPFVHIYWPGFLMFVVIGFGILGSAPISSQRMRNPRWGYLAAVAAGPLSNLLLALLSALALRLAYTSPQMLFAASGTSLTFQFLWQMIYWNVLLFVFNLLPFFPIDGWHIVGALLPADLAWKWRDYAQTTQYILLALIVIGFLNIPGFDPLSLLIRQPTTSIARWLMQLAIPALA